MTYQLKITLKGIRPPVWRRVRVSGDLSFAQLHGVVQIAMGWTDSHLHQFRIGDERFAIPSREDWDRPADERKARLSEVAAEKDRFHYDYDFGDGWEHEILVEKITPPDADLVAECLDGRRACPPEDCGGPYGYANLLGILADPSHEEHAEMKEWAGGELDPESFDAAAVNRLLAKYGPKRRRSNRRPRIAPAP
jgi:hypothetical protein